MDKLRALKQPQKPRNESPEMKTISGDSFPIFYRSEWHTRGRKKTPEIEPKTAPIGSENYKNEKSSLGPGQYGGLKHRKTQSF